MHVISNEMIRQTFNATKPAANCTRRFSRQSAVILKKRCAPRVESLLASFSSVVLKPNLIVYNSTYRNDEYRCFSSESTRGDDVSNLTNQLVDFFEEPITFLASESSTKQLPVETILVYDEHLLQVLSKGKVSKDGGDEFGLATKAAHSSAITWSELIRHLVTWCRKDAGGMTICEAPMLAVLAFAPLLVHGGVAYLMNLDEHYWRGTPSFYDIVQSAVGRKDDEKLTRRERLHLYSLGYLFQNEHAKALSILSKILEIFPGDALALSFAIDIAEVLGDEKSAFRCATSVASYWNERSQRSAIGGTVIAGHSIGSSLIAVGLASGGRNREAESMAERVLTMDVSGFSGIAAMALAKVYSAEGRASEGASTFTGYGVEYYDSCGYLFLDSKMGGIGAKFIMNRDGANADRVALRLYDEHFSRIIEYSGYDGGQNGSVVIRRRPSKTSKILLETATGAVTSLFDRLFGKNSNSVDESNMMQGNHAKDEIELMEDAIIKESEPRTIEDILTWLPPTVSVLVDATFLLFRLTVSGAINAGDSRWHKLGLAWKHIYDIEAKHGRNADENDQRVLFNHAPLARVASALLLDNDTIGQRDNKVSRKIEQAARKLGQLMNIKRCSTDDQNNVKDEWAEIVRLLDEVRTGWARCSSCTAQPMNQLLNDIDVDGMVLQSFIEHAICHAATQAGDYDSLCVARSICSESVTLRANSPENWHRYGVILEKLGDTDNARNAFHASVSLGIGEGGRVGS
jgi:hypothetical protein